MNIPVIGNGDIFEPIDAVKMLQETACDGIMIGRGALGNPWIFENVINLFEGREAREISVNEVVDTAIWHLGMMIEQLNGTYKIENDDLTIDPTNLTNTPLVEGAVNKLRASYYWARL